MKRFIIKSIDSGHYFEQDFAGWSWQEDVSKAYKFKDKAKAEEGAVWLRQSNFPCEIVELAHAEV